MRNMIIHPYTEDETRIVNYILRITKGEIGGGDDPLGWLLASHELMVNDRAARIRAGMGP